MTHRPTVYGTRHAISAGHYLAAAAGFSILEAGGNAIDAGCRRRHRAWRAATRPGELRRRRTDHHPPRRRHRRKHRRPWLVAEDAPGRPVHARAWRQNPRRRAAHRRSPPPPTPGSPRCAATAPCASPTSPPRRSVSPPRDSRSIRCWPPRSPRMSKNTAAGPPTPRSSCPTAASPKPGDKFVQADLARTIQFMADQDRAAGPDRLAGLKAAHHAFYRGDIAREIVRFQQQEGGYLSWTISPNTIPRIEPVVRRHWRGARTDHLRPVVPGPRPATGAGFGRAGRHRRAWRITRRTTCTASSSA